MKTTKTRWAWLIGLVAILGLVAGACSSDDDDKAEPQVTQPTEATDDTTATNDDDATDDKPEFVLGGPQDCPTNPFCLIGLQSAYGVDLEANFVPLDGAGPLTVAALKGGEIDVAVLFSTNPVIAEEGWVVLADTEGLINADNILPVSTDAIAEAYGSDFAGVVNAVSAALTTSELTELNRQFEIELIDADKVALEWLEDQELLGGPIADLGDGPQIVIGAQDFTESELLSQIYGQALADAGFDVKYQALGGYRDIVFASFESGDINFTIEYAASALEFLNQSAGEATGDADETVGLLTPYLEDKGLLSWEVSSAVDSNAFVVTAETAAKYGLVSIGDLK